MVSQSQTLGLPLVRGPVYDEREEVWYVVSGNDSKLFPLCQYLLWGMSTTFREVFVL